MQMVEWEWWRHGWGLYDAEKEAAAEAEAASEVIPVFRPLGSVFPGLLCMSRLRPTVRLIWNSQVLFRYVRGLWALPRKRTSAETNQRLCSPCCGAPLPPMGRSA